jgi:hypothetical protein
MDITAHHSTRDSLAELRERRPGGETIAHSSTDTNTNSNSNSNSNTSSNTNSNSNSNSKTSR